MDTSKLSALELAAALAQVPAVQVVTDMEELGMQVRARRKQQRLRIDDAAAMIGVSVDLFSRLENGAGGIRTHKLLTILDNLGLVMIIAPRSAENEAKTNGCARLQEW